MVRDVVIILLLTALGGFVVGLAAGSTRLATPQAVLAIAASNILLGTVGFIISGALARGARWRHLAIVASLVWLASAINMPVMGLHLAQWLFAAPLTVMMMAIGGGLSYVFRRDARV